MSEIKLKPCPFCGGEGKLIASGFNDCYSLVKCEQCGAESAPFKISKEYCSDEKAAEAWNRRTDDIKKKCPNCGKEFFPLAVNQIYCSTKCRNIFYRNQKLEQED